MAAAVPPGFFYPAGATAPLAAAVTRAIYAAPAAPELLPYAASLDTQVRLREDGAGRVPPEPSRRGLVSEQRWLPTFAYPRWSGDVLVVGESRRDAETALMARIVDGVVRTGRSVLYLSTSRSEHVAMLGHRREAGWGERCALARIATVASDRLQYWLHRGAPAEMRRDARSLDSLLAAHGACIAPGATWALREVATAKVQWQILKRRLAFHDGVITRTNYMPLSTALLADSFAGDRLSISLQHSIITCPSSFAPLLAKRYLCFGDCSRSLLRDLDEELARATRSDGTGCELISAGNYLDPIPAAAAAREPGTVLVVDQTSHWAQRFYGGGDEPFEALHRLVPQLAQSAAVRRIVVRLHPTGDGTPVWERIAAPFPGRVVLGPWQRPLEEHLAGASVVVGLFSTVLATAAAAGLPSLFVWQPGWFYTPDLAPFAATQFVTPAAAVPRIETLLRDADRFSAECRSARAAAASYFDGYRCDFDTALMDEVLRPHAAPQLRSTTSTPAARIHDSNR